MKKIVIVGGGAGGLELATQLGGTLGKNHTAQITLVDKNANHLWKPLLHEIATGELNDDLNYVDYSVQGRSHYFQFKQGELLGIDREKKQIKLNHVVNGKNEIVFPETELNYDILVIAIGSQSNDFGTPGVREHCMFLDEQESAKSLRALIVTTFFKFSSQIIAQDKLNIAIVGAGATGVELTTGLLSMIKKMGEYGFPRLTSSALNITLIEAADRILPALPAKVGNNIKDKLEELGATVLTNTKIVNTDSTHFFPENRDAIYADILIWTAGIKAPDFLKGIAGLETNRANQLVTKATLQTTNDPSIFAIGDCCACPKPDGGVVPATAQAAHQMVSVCKKNIIALIKGSPMKDFHYNNKGTIISLAHTAQGVVNIIGKSQMGVKGWIAFYVYKALYRMHQVALFGFIKTLRLMRASKVYATIRTTIKMN